MPDTAATPAFGVILKKGGALSADTFTDWGLEVTNVSAPGVTRTAIDATHHQSPDGWGEVIMSGVKRQKPFTLEFNWVPADTASLLAVVAGDMVYWKMEFPDGSSVVSKLGITDFSMGDGLTPDGKMTGSAEFTPSGKPVWA